MAHCHHLLAILLKCMFCLGARPDSFELCRSKLSCKVSCIVEGRAVVHIGIRDSIVHVERRKPTLTTIVSVATTAAQTKTGAGITAWFVTACKGTKNNRYERMSKSENAKKIDRPRAVRLLATLAGCSGLP